MTQLPERHTVYLTNTAWKGLKERAILEESSASGIVAYLLASFINTPADFLPLTRYQSRIAEDQTEQRKRRTIYVPDPTWLEITALCAARGYSVSGVIEYTLLRYLGLLPDESSADKAPTAIAEPKPTLKPSNRLDFDLGDNPFQIDLTPDKDK